MQITWKASRVVNGKTQWTPAIPLELNVSLQELRRFEAVAQKYFPDMDGRREQNVADRDLSDAIRQTRKA